MKTNGLGPPTMLLVHLLMSAAFTSSALECPKVCSCTSRAGQHVVTCERKKLQEIPAGIPANTNELYLGYNLITKVKNNTLAELGQLKVLSLKGNVMYKLESNAFAGLSNLKSLYLTDNLLWEVNRMVFLGLDQLTNLYLTQNKLTAIPDLGSAVALRKLNLDKNNLKKALFPSSFRSLVNLKSIVLNNNNIGIIHEDDFKVFSKTNIVKLGLTKCSLTEIENGTFSHFNSLVSLTLSYNRIPNDKVKPLIDGLGGSNINSLDLSGVIGGETLPANTFSGLNGVPLMHLFMRHSQVGVLRNHTFATLGKLQTLDLSYAHITATEKDAFAGLVRLGTLLLHHNPLQLFPVRLPASLVKLYMNHNTNVDTLDNLTLQKLVNLKELHMEHCALRVVKSDSFIDTTNLLKLDMSNNVFGSNSFPTRAFKSMARLKVLDLSSNKMTKFPTEYNIFYHLTSLEVLNFSRNGCERMPPKLFWPLHALQRLDLTGNLLSDMIALDNGTLFQFLGNLRELNISENKLRELPSKVFHGLKQMLHMDLSHNYLSYWAPGVFDNASSLARLDLANNHISVINSTSFNRLSRLSWLNLANNPFACYCDLIWFRNWLNTTNVTLPNLDQYCCNSPKDMQGKPLVTFNPLSIAKACKPLSLVIILSVTVATILFLFTLSGSVVYRYRWKLRLSWYQFKRRHVSHTNNGDDGQLVVDTDYLYDAFVSVSENTADDDWVRDELVPKMDNGHVPAETIEFLGRHSLFYPSFHLMGGVGLMSGLAEAIEASRHVIVILSKDYLQQPQKRDYELELALFKLPRDWHSLILVVKDAEALAMIPRGPLHAIVENGDALEWTEDAEGQILFWDLLQASIDQGPEPRHEQLS